MTTDELLKKLPTKIGRNPIYENGEIIAFASDEYDGCDIGWLYLHNDGKGWCAYYGRAQHIFAGVRNNYCKYSFDL